MSFFGKMRDRLFRSSSKLEEGLDAIVENGGEVAPAGDPQDASAETEPQSAVDQSAVAAPSDAPAAGPGLVGRLLGRSAPAAPQGPAAPGLRVSGARFRIGAAGPTAGELRQFPSLFAM